jgi:hypothetical protein
MLGHYANLVRSTIRYYHINLEHDLEKTVNMKLILSIIKQLSGLKISFQRVGFYCFGKAKELEEEYKRIFWM